MKKLLLAVGLSAGSLGMLAIPASAKDATGTETPATAAEFGSGPVTAAISFDGHVLYVNVRGEPVKLQSDIDAWLAGGFGLDRQDVKGH